MLTGYSVYALIKLAENCIQTFHLGYSIYGWKFSFTATLALP